MFFKTYIYILKIFKINIYKKIILCKLYFTINIFCYSEFCERIILCNSLIWSCSITGKTNMTFEEALLCEENAKRSLKEFPMEVYYNFIIYVKSSL